MNNIAFVHEKFPIGGAERVTLDIARYLSKNNPSYCCYVLASEFMEELFPDDMNGIIKRRTIPKKEGRAESVERLVRDECIDIVVQVVQPLEGIGEIARRTGCKVVFANHGEPFWQQYSIIRKSKKKILNRLFWHLGAKRKYVKNGRALDIAKKRTFKHYCESDAYTVLCEGYKNTICQAFGIRPEESRIHVIGNSERVVDDVVYEKEKIIMYCGRLEYVSKRPDCLLRIWGAVQDSLPDYRLLIVGDGLYRRTLEKQIRKEGLRRVEMIGAKKDVAPYYRKASIVCLTSRTEGWGLCLTEAQANGCIPVAFGCSDGVKDILSPSGVNGFAVTPFDEDEYARTLIRITGMSEDELLVIRKSAVAKRAEYVPDIVMKKWEMLFDELLKIPGQK